MGQINQHLVRSFSSSVLFGEDVHQLDEMLVIEYPRVKAGLEQRN